MSLDYTATLSYPYNVRMSKSILVAGINGFVGKHLARELYQQGHLVYGTGTDEDISSEIASSVTKYVQCDLTSPQEVEKLPLEEIDAIINLAGLAQPSTSFGKEELYNRINVEVHSVLIEHIQKSNLKIRILAVSTGAVYDNNQAMPLTERSTLVEGGSPYAASKVLLERTLDKYIREGIEIVIARPFNHTGPGQLDGFIVPDLTSKILTQDELTIGPLNTSRDYTDVRDVVRAYRMIIEKSEQPLQKIYNVCSGIATSRDQLIEKIKAATGNKSLEIHVDQTLVRPNDAPLIYGNSDLLKNEFSWQPSISIDQTISDYVKWKKDLTSY